MVLSKTSTLEAYEKSAELYAQLTVRNVEGRMKEWLDKFIGQIASDTTVFELGSGTGRDAKYLLSQGVKVQCSDAVSSFISKLVAEGFPAIKFDILEDEFPKNKWRAVLANAVLLHFTDEEFRYILRKIYASLTEDGTFAFSLKVGEGSGWETEKLDMPRYFKYWSKAEVSKRLAVSGYIKAEIIETNGWLHIIASK